MSDECPRCAVVGLDYELDAEITADTPERMKAPRRPAPHDRARPRARAGDDRDRARRTPETAAGQRRLPRRHPASPPGSSRSCGPGSVRAVDERYYGRTARTIKFHQHDTRRVGVLQRRTRRGRLRAARGRSNRAPTPRCAGPASRASRAEEFAARLDALSLEFIALPRNGDLEFGLFITLYPTTRLDGAVTAAVDDSHVRATPRPAVLQAVLGQCRLEPRRRRAA